MKDLTQGGLTHGKTLTELDKNSEEVIAPLKKLRKELKGQNFYEPKVPLIDEYHEHKPLNPYEQKVLFGLPNKNLIELEEELSTFKKYHQKKGADKIYVFIKNLQASKLNEQKKSDDIDYNHGYFEAIEFIIEKIINEFDIENQI